MCPYTSYFDNSTIPQVLLLQLCVQCLQLHRFVCAFPETGLLKRTMDIDGDKHRKFPPKGFGIIYKRKSQIQSKHESQCLWMRGTM